MKNNNNKDYEKQVILDTVFLTVPWLIAQPVPEQQSWNLQISAPGQPSFIYWAWHLRYRIFPLASLS